MRATFELFKQLYDEQSAQLRAAIHASPSSNLGANSAVVVRAEADDQVAGELVEVYCM